MVTDKDLQALVEFISDDPLVVSLYLNVDPTQTTKEEIRLTLRGLLKQAGEKASSKDIQAIERFFDMEYSSGARGLILFSCQAQGLWKVFPLAVPVENRVVTARRPFLTPLQDALNAYARYGVVLADKEGARLFLFHLGELQEAEGILGEELKKHRQGGRSASKWQRKAGETALANLRDVVEMTRAFCEEKHCQRLILAGNAENVALFRGMLPKYLQERVVGEMALDMYAGEVEVGDKTLALIRKTLRDEEDALVEQMVTAAAKGEAGALGLADTLDALQQEKVHILLVSEGYEAAGARCTHCGYLSSETAPACRYCRAPMRPYDHLVDAAVRQAIGRGVSVRVVVGNPALQKAGQIGALLRY
jgi:peptide subunit release factor 1 (eRF1)